MTNYFETLGYSKDYYLDGKYIGSLTLQEKDREVMSYFGRRIETTSTDIVFPNKKSIPSGSVVMTELQILCGRLKKKYKINP